MPQESTTAESGRLTASLGCLVIAIACLIPVALIVTPVVSYHRVMTGFLAQHAEADPLIEAIYLHYFATGKWPKTLQALGRPEMSDAPPEWRYRFQCEEPTDPPILDNRGPLHMWLVYTFRENGLPQSPGGWKATCEGTPVRYPFVERIPIKPILGTK